MNEFWNAWNWNPLTGAFLALLGWRYMDGVWRLWHRAGTGRGVRRWQVMSFWAGWLVLFIALTSPIDTLGETSLTMHMIQHLLLTLVAPPLLVIGLPTLALVGMIPMRWRRGMGRWWHRNHRLQRLWQLLNEPVTVWSLFALALWLWHIPALYQAALVSPAAHLIEHGSFFGTGLLFWWHVHRLHALSVLTVFTTAMHSSILGALMTFSGQIWYPAYGSLQDQQIAGLIMWIPGGVVFVIAIVLLLWRWLDEMEKHDAKTVV